MNSCTSVAGDRRLGAFGIIMPERNRIGNSPGTRMTSSGGAWAIPVAPCEVERTHERRSRLGRSGRWLSGALSRWPGASHVAPAYVIIFIVRCQASRCRRRGLLGNAWRLREPPVLLLRAGLCINAVAQWPSPSIKSSSHGARQWPLNPTPVPRKMSSIASSTLPRLSAWQRY